MSHSPIGRTAWHLSSNRWNSAITEYALSTMRALQPFFEHTVWSPLTGSPGESRGHEITDLEVVPVHQFYLQDLPHLARIATRSQPDHIFVYGGRETTLTGILAVLRRLGKARARIYRIRGYAVPENPSGLARLQHRIAHAHVDRLVTPSHQLSTAVLSRLGTRPMTATVPLGCDSKRYAFDAKSRWSEGRPSLVIFGRFDPVKGHRRAMQIFRRVLELGRGTYPRPILKILGLEANVTVANLRDWAAAEGLLDQDIVIDCRRVENVGHEMSSATVGWISSLGSEEICRVAQEFLMCGTPVAVSGVGALSEVLFAAGAGATYAGMSDAEAAVQLSSLLAQAWIEKAATREQRAEEARARFSIAAMGVAWSKVLQYDTVRLP